MTDEPYLIAHKVRGEAAFDIAIQMDCPICKGRFGDDIPKGCDECDGEGYWWICSTSGHRARPYWHLPLDDIEASYGKSPIDICPDMPEGWPDHYPTPSSPKAPSPLASILAAFKPKALDIKRRL